LRRRHEILDHFAGYFGVVSHDPEQNLRIYPRFHAATVGKAEAGLP
jgi:hypothetical protein